MEQQTNEKIVLLDYDTRLERKYPLDSNLDFLYNEIQNFFRKKLSTKEKKYLENHYKKLKPSRKNFYNKNGQTLSEYVDAYRVIVEGIKCIEPNKYEIYWGT